MYVEALNVGVVCIPKNGTHTLEHAINTTYPEQPQGLFAGHARASRLKQLVTSQYGEERASKMRIMATVRNPSQRFVSGLNHRWAGTPDIDLDEAIDRSFKAAEDFVFMSQISWLDCHRQRLALFTMDNIGTALKRLGYKGGKPPHLNKSQPRWDFEEVIEHKLFDLVREKYSEDYDIFHTVRQWEEEYDVFTRGTQKDAGS